MHSAIAERIAKIADDLVSTAEAKFRFPEKTVTGQRMQTEAFSGWRSKVLHLFSLLGDSGTAWKETLGNPTQTTTGPDFHWSIPRVVGGLRSLADCAREGLMTSVEQLVQAELHANLLEQAEDLLSGNYYLAAGVVGRAVLEEHLRAWCSKASCFPQTNRPTIEDYKTALYKNNHLDKNAMMHVQAMGAIGNSAAHNDPNFRPEDVERLLRDLRQFLVQFAH